MKSRSRFLKPTDRPVAEIVRERLKSGNTLRVSEIVNEFYKRGGETSFKRATSVLTSVREKLEVEEGRVLICRSGNFRLIDKHEPSAELEEVRLRQKRAAGHIRTYTRSQYCFKTNNPKLRDKILLEQGIFKDYVARLQEEKPMRAKQKVEKTSLRRMFFNRG